MSVESPPKYVNRELNSQISIRSQDSHFSKSDGAPPTSKLLWGAAYCVRYVKRDANDSLCTYVLDAMRQSRTVRARQSQAPHS